MVTKIAAVILTRNEARHIRACIETLQWADMMILEDSFSQDGTVEIAAGLGAQVFQQEFINFAVARNNALQNARDLGADWVLFVDADERVTPELAAEIRQVTGRPSLRPALPSIAAPVGATPGRVSKVGSPAGWWIPRYNVMWGHTMRGGGWYPDCQLRLMLANAARYDPERQVHEIVLLDGPADYLRQHLIHYNYDSLAQFKSKQNRYLNFEAQILREKGIRARPWTYLTMPAREFYRRYVQLKGYRDGWVGLQVCSLMSWYMLNTYLRLRRLHRAGPAA